MTKILIGNLVKLYKYNFRYRQHVDFSVGPVCLAVERKGRPHLKEGKIVMSGWGRTYDDGKSIF